MEGDVAREVIRTQNLTLREHILLLVNEQTARADEVLETIAPWLNKPWREQAQFVRARDLQYADPRYFPAGGTIPPGHNKDKCDVRPRPELRKALQDAYEWMKDERKEGDRWRAWRDLPLLSIDSLRILWRDDDEDDEIDPGMWTNFSVLDRAAELSLTVRLKILIQPNVCWNRNILIREVRKTYEQISKLARRLSPMEVPEFLPLPEDVHPPLHGRINDGILARLLSKEVAQLIYSGHALSNSLGFRASTPPDVMSWREGAIEVLTNGFGNVVSERFSQLTYGAYACAAPVPDSSMLADAYLTLGLIYLEEVQERVSDYAEASGQAMSEPRVSMTFRGSTFHGAQFAAQIANIDSTISGVISTGGGEVAQALRALERAVLSQDALDDEQRQDLLDNISDLADAAQTPAERRNRGRVKSALAFLNAAACGATEVAKALEAWGPILHRLTS